MANFDRILSISLLFMIISVPSIVSRSTQSSDLIDGNEFLSLFIEKENADKLEGYELDEIRVTSTINGKNYEEDTLDVTAQVSKQDELLAEESTNYGLNLKNNSQNHKQIDLHIDNLKLQNATEMAADGSDIPNGLEKKTNDGKINEEEIEMKQIVKYITSGSKIVFLEDILKSNESTTTPNYTNYLTTNKDIVPNHSLSDNIHVSISISSTVDKGPIPEANKPNVFNYFESVKTTSNKKTFEDTNDRNLMKKTDFISRSHKSDFSIEESDPVAESLSDSVNGESTNVHSVVAPPSSISQSQSPRHMASEVGRMQRKQQDKLVPFQTVIYHDAGYNKDGSSQPRSVSYSSLTQNVDDLSMWKDLESFLEVKRNVSDVLKPVTERSHSQPEKIYSEPAKFYSEPAKIYGEPAKFYSQPAKVYSEPAKVYGEPERQHGLPAQIYSEPAKVYSEPAKTYSEPAKVYGEPSKVYWPLPLTTTPRPPPHESITQQPLNIKPSRRIISNLDKLPYDLLNSPESHKRLLEPDLSAGRRSRPSTPPVLRTNENRGPYNGNPPGEGLNRQHKDLVTARPSQHSTVTHNPQEIYTPTPEQNYEIEESVSVMTNGRAHGVQPLKVSPTANPTEDAKVGYVVEGRNFRKYRVEEKTSDGFIVGEYGVVSHNDDSIRGVRYTADSNINPSLIQEALKKFLAL